jgi:hypothetical protein
MISSGLGEKYPAYFGRIKMKKQPFSVLILGLFLGVLFLSAFMVVPAAEAKGTVTRIELSGSAQYPKANGTAKYKVDGRDREFQVELEDARQLAGSKVTVFVDGRKAGAFKVSALGTGRMKRSTERGQTVPNITDGSTVQIKTRSGALVVSGSF